MQIGRLTGYLITTMSVLGLFWGATCVVQRLRPRSRLALPSWTTSGIVINHDFLWVSPPPPPQRAWDILINKRPSVHFQSRR